MSSLILYDAMCAAIDRAYRVDEVKDIRDKALAIEVYARQAKNKEAEQKAEKIRLRAEHKAGRLLAQMEKATGARGNPGGRGAPIVRSGGHTAQTLSNLRISKQQSSRWQRIGGLSDEVFERAIESPKPTVAVNVIVKREKRLELLHSRAEATAIANARLADMPPEYDIVAIDPPWQLWFWNRETGLDRAADNHYETIEKDGIKPVRIPARPVAALMLWCTCAVLAVGWPHEIARTWGFTPKAVWSWRKADEDDQDQAGTAYCLKNNSEHILWCTRGDFPSFPIGQQPLSCISAPRAEHSAKPDIFYELISQHYPGMRKLEMYARKLRPDWDSWGNEVPGGLLLLQS